MDSSPHGQLPADLVRAQQQFQAWRDQRTPGTRIPQALWEIAVQLVKVHGVSRTAAALRLDYYSLKQRAEDVATPNSPTPPPFIEVTPPLLLARQCRFEFENRSGVVIRVQLVGYDAADIEALSRGFGNARSCSRSLRR
jgi:hypothetical protein